MKKNIVIAIIVIIGFVAIVQGGKFFNQLLDQNKFGGVTQGNEYNSTSTSPSTTFFKLANYSKLKGGPGVLGSVVVTTAGSNGQLNFYNATTSNRYLRTGQTATSSILMVSLPNNLAAGTYTFDIGFTAGLLVDWSGTIGTSTITWR